MGGTGKQVRVALAGLLGATLSLPAVAAAAIDFAPRTSTPTAAPALAVSVSDLNADTLPDVVVNVAPSSVAVHGGLGGGVFSAASALGVGEFPAALTVADFNGDAKPDVAVANFSSRNVSILLGDGTGGFSVAAPVAVGTGPFALAAGDVSGDGKADLVVLNGESVNASLLVGNGDGTFVPSFFAVGPSGGSDVAIGDVSGDGKPDLVVSGAGIRIILGPLTGTIPAGSVIVPRLASGRLALADLNVDGRLDIAATTFGSNQVATLLNLGGNAYAAPLISNVSWLPTALAVGDVNADGIPDIATANVASDDVSVLEGRPGGAFRAAKQFRTGLGPQGIQTADLNADGRADLVVANGGGSISVLLARPLAAGSKGSAKVKLTCATPRRIVVTNDEAAIGCVGLTASRARVVEYLGTPKSIKRGTRTGDVEYVYTQFFVDFLRGDNAVNQLGTVRPGVGFANGVRVGAPAALVKKRFPNVRCQSRNGVRFCQVNKGPFFFIGFVIKGTVITEIDLGFRD